MNGLLLATRLVASVLAGECGHEPLEGRLAVGETVAVRMLERRQDAVTVVTARDQYCAWKDARHAKAVAAEWERVNPKRWAELMDLASHVINGTFVISENRWNYFYRPTKGKRPPSWIQDFIRSKRIGKHLFGRIP